MLSGQFLTTPVIRPKAAINPMSRAEEPVEARAHRIARKGRKGHPGIHPLSDCAVVRADISTDQHHQQDDANPRDRFRLAGGHWSAPSVTSTWHVSYGTPLGYLKLSGHSQRALTPFATLGYRMERLRRTARQTVARLARRPIRSPLGRYSVKGPWHSYELHSARSCREASTRFPACDSWP